MQQHCKSLTSYGFVDSFVEIHRPNRNVSELTHSRSLKKEKYNGDPLRSISLPNQTE